MYYTLSHLSTGYCVMIMVCFFVIALVGFVLNEGGPEFADGVKIASTPSVAGPWLMWIGVVGGVGFAVFLFMAHT